MEKDGQAEWFYQPLVLTLNQILSQKVINRLLVYQR